MNLLFVANRIPYPPYRGDKLKIYNLSKRLCRKHTLHLLTFIQSEDELEHLVPLREIFTHIEVIYLPKTQSIINAIAYFFTGMPLQVLYFRSRRFQKMLNEYLKVNKPDAIHVQHLRMAQYLENHKEQKRILDLPDAFSLYWQRRKTVKRSLISRIVDSIESKRVIRYEKVLHKFNMSLVCSAEDLDFLKEKHEADNIRLLPNGVDLDTFYPRNHDYSHNHRILFTGNMDYAPNIDAVQYFVKDILPFVKKQFPETEFIIAGQRPVAKVLELKGEDVEITGFVKDLAEMYDTASIVVAPLRFGAGTQNKVLEAMAMGIPVVCSHVGFKGLGIQSGEGAIMQTEAEGFAQSVIDLLRDEGYRKTVGEKGAEVIRNNFGWDAISERLEGYFEEVAKG
ncbi:MAG: glycosyltransferase [Bacteroidia bacterium]|nr:glycosyltransferase [Bacteroidia bacterium]